MVQTMEGNGPSKQVPLEKIDVRLCEELRLLLGLDTLRGRRDAEAACESLDGRNRSGAIAASWRSLRKGFVDLDLVEGKADEIAQRRITRSKIVKDDANAEILELPHGRKMCGVLFQQRGF